MAWKWGGQAAYVWNQSLLAARFERQFSNEPASSRGGEAVSATRPLRGQGLAQDVVWGPCPGDTPRTTNPIDWSRFFVQRHYKDFFDRNDPGNYWTAAITFCGFDQACIAARRISVSRSFMYSPEYVGLHPELDTQRGTHEYNAAFVLLCYQTYLRRQPNDPPDGNWNGYNHWVNKLDNTNPDASDWKYDEMVSAFINSPEYRDRFVQPGP